MRSYIAGKWTACTLCHFLRLAVKESDCLKCLLLHIDSSYSSFEHRDRFILQFSNSAFDTRLVRNPIRETWLGFGGHDNFCLLTFVLVSSNQEILQIETDFCRRVNAFSVLSVYGHHLTKIICDKIYPFIFNSVNQQKHKTRWRQNGEKRKGKLQNRLIKILHWMPKKLIEVDWNFSDMLKKETKELKFGFAPIVKITKKGKTEI